MHIQSQGPGGKVWGWHSVDEIPADHRRLTDEEIEERLRSLDVPLTREQVEQLRLTAYADPVTGSDRYFAEAARMQAMGEPGWEVVRAAGVARFEEIQAAYPWPAE